MKKNIDILDLTKFILSLMIVAIHTGLFPSVLYPWLYLAVPLFFIISSYLLFSKIKSLPAEKHKETIKHYIFRILKLYLFWFIVLLPITIQIRDGWFADGLWIGLFKTTINLFLGSTFVASWFLTALIFDTLIVNKLSKKHNKFLLFISIVSYLICCYFSSYHYILSSPIYDSVINFYNPALSMFVGLIFIMVGKMFAEKEITLSKKKSIILFIVSCGMLYVEWFAIYRIAGFNSNGCYIAIIPTTIFLFNLIKNVKLQIKNSKILRQFSNFTYPLHGSIVHVLLKLGVPIGFFNFSITLIICLLFFFIVKKLECKIEFLKYSH